MNCGSYRGTKLLEHVMKIVDKVLEKKLCNLVNLDKLEIGFTPENS